MVEERFTIGERKVTWIELFFDLAFVAAAHEVAQILKSTSSFLEGLPFVLFFLLALWVWLGHTTFTSRFEVYGSWYNLLTFATMLVVIGMVLTMERALHEYIVYFSIIYAVGRFLLCAMYVIAALKHPSHFIILLPVLASLLCSGVLWLFAFQTSYVYWLWGLAFMIDFLTPIISSTVLKKIKVHSTHLPERLGLLTVIMLGEMIIATVASVHGKQLDVGLLGLIFSGVITIGMIFWVYFSFVEKNIMASHRANQRLYLYAHLPVFVGLVILASGYKGIIAGYESSWLVILGIVLFMIGLRAIKMVYDNRLQRRQLVAIFCFTPFLIIYYFSTIPSMLNTIVLSFLFVAYLFIAEFLLGWYGKR